MDPGNAKIKRVSICGKWIYTHGVVVDQPEKAPAPPVVTGQYTDKRHRPG